MLFSWLRHRQQTQCAVTVEWSLFWNKADGNGWWGDRNRCWCLCKAKIIELTTGLSTVGACWHVKTLMSSAWISHMVKHIFRTISKFELFVCQNEKKPNIHTILKKAVLMMLLVRLTFSFRLPLLSAQRWPLTLTEQHPSPSARMRSRSMSTTSPIPRTWSCPVCPEASCSTLASTSSQKKSWSRNLWSKRPRRCLCRRNRRYDRSLSSPTVLWKTLETGKHLHEVEL